MSYNQDSVFFSIFEFDTLDELKKSIKEKLEKSNEQRAKYETEDAAIKAVCEDSKLDIPSGMIETEIDAMIRDLEQQLSYQGISLEQYLHIINKTKEEIEDLNKTTELDTLVEDLEKTMEIDLNE